MDTKNTPNTEPTLYDIIKAMQKGFESVDARFERLESEMKTGFQSLSQRMFKLELRMEDVADIVHGQEKRLIVLERWKKNTGKAGLAGA